MKKRTFFSFWIKRWLISLLVAGILCIPLTHIICEETIEDTVAEKMLVPRAIMRQYDWAELVYENDGSDEELNYKKYKALGHMCGARPGSVIVDMDGNLIVPNENVAILQTTASPGRPLTCDLSYFEGLDYEGRLELYTRDIYYNEKHFLPGKCDILYNASKRGEKNIGTIDLTSENTDGYTHTTEKSGLIGFSVIRSQEHIEALENPWYHHKYSASNESTYVLATKGFLKYIFYEQVRGEYGEHTFQLLTSIEVDIWEIGMQKFITTYVIMFVLSIFAGVVWALISYKNYEKFRFQRILTNSLAHDLKSPLTVVSGYVENIEQDICPEKRASYIHSIGQNVGHMNDIISNIIELSKFENNKKRLPKALCNMTFLIQELLEKYKSSIEDKELLVEVKGEGIYLCNEMAMSRAFENLINNAVIYAPKQGKIIINITNKFIEVSNTYDKKITLKPEQLFDPFVKGDESRGSSGTGLGLCIAKGIFDMHKFDSDIEFGEMFKVKITKVNLLDRIKKYRIWIIVIAAIIILASVAGGIYSCWRNSFILSYEAKIESTENKV